MSDLNGFVAGEKLGLSSRQAIVLVVDLVESVRLMEADETGVIERWFSFAQYVTTVVLPNNEGRLVKNLGDGLMAEFKDASEAVRAADAMHAWMRVSCSPIRNGERMSLRAGLHATKIYDGVSDIYGIGVNLAARVTTLAEAGETIATAPVRDLLLDALDADIEDLGDCHLKHVERPVRAFRLGPSQHANSLPRENSRETTLLASIAVIPFLDLLPSEQFAGVSDLIADGIINSLSMSANFRVVSRLSSACFKGRTSSPREIGDCLDVRYVVSGTYAISGSSIAVSAELADVLTDSVVWSHRARGDWRELLELDSELTQLLADGIHRSFYETTAARASTRPLPTLNSYELFLGGISMMHRANADDFEVSQRLLASLTERHHRIATPHAWLGKWYVLRTIQGAAGDVSQSAVLALRHTQKALELEPQNALALAIEGFVYFHLKKDLKTAEQRLLEACALNPSEGLAWLFQGVMHAFQGEAAPALEAGYRALSLSPMDPLRYYYESLVGSCEFGAGHYAEAIRWCEASRRRNRHHLSTLRILIAAYAAIDDLVHARALGMELRRMRPDYTVATYEAHSVAMLFPFGQRIATAMRAAGVP